MLKIRHPMNVSSITDIRLSIAVIATVVFTVLIADDALYIGLWYYVTVPVVAFFIVLPFRPFPLFNLGASVGLALTFYFYLCINYFSNHPGSGLLGLGHIFSLPGAALGIILMAFMLKRRSNKSAKFGFVAGLFGLLIGFFINQIIVCNTLMWCGPLSVEI